MATLEGPRNGRWKGGKYLTDRGWVRITAGRNRGRYEHQVVWEEYHGRLIPKGYDIHHRNGKPWWNEPSNLELQVKSHHGAISGKRARAGFARLTAYDLTPLDFKYLRRKGVSIPERFDVPF